MKPTEKVVHDLIVKIIKKYLPTYELKEKETVKEFKPKLKSKLIYYLDAGHGGINPINNKYQSPRKQYIYKSGLAVYEGVLNRKVLDKVIELSKDLPYHLQYELTAHKWKDTPLNERTNKINKGCEVHGKGNCRLISIHHNGFKRRLSANGIEIFYQKDDKFTSENGKKMAIEFNKSQAKEMSQFRNRGVKPNNLHMTRKSNCVAVLMEGGFMTNKEDTIKMMSEKGIESYAKAIIAGIKATEEGLV